MVNCPRCGSGVDHLHPVPPEVITKELVAVVGDDEGPIDLESCRDCVGELMADG